MSLGVNSSKGENSSQSSSSTAFDPEIKALFMDNAARARDIAAAPFQAFTGSRVAAPVGPGIADQRYTDALGGVVTDQVGGVALDAAKNAATGVSHFQSQDIAANPIAAGLLRDTNLDPYMSKYTAGVIDAALADIDHEAAVADQYAKSRATSAGAWGGSGEGVLRGLTGDSYVRAKTSTVANLRDQNFRNAQDMAVGDITRKLGADQFNSTQALTAAQANQQAAQQAAALRTQGAGLLGTISQQQLDQAKTRAGLLGTIADRAQAFNDQQTQYRQGVLDADYEEFLRSIEDPILKQQLINQAYGLLPSSPLSSSQSSSKGTSSSFGVSGNFGAPK